MIEDLKYLKFVAKAMVSNAKFCESRHNNNFLLL